MKYVLPLVVPPLLAVYVLAVALIMDTSQPLAQYLILAPLAYVLGSVPWGFLVVRLFHGVDVRDFGSGRTGTSNVLRTGGLKSAALVLVLDLSKGALAVLLAKVVADTAAADVTTGLLVLAGHNWSLFLGFKGGRGIMPAAGAVLVISPIALALCVVAWAAAALATRYVSLASLSAVTMAVVAAAVQIVFFDFSYVYLIYFGIGGFIIFWQHSDNIMRLRHGAEPRLGQRVKPADSG
jgi:glycerol-3-phosphate acyltransferase PlsY